LVESGTVGMGSIVADRGALTACRHDPDGAASDNGLMTMRSAVPIELSTLEERVLSGRARFAAGRVARLTDCARSGRPRAFTDVAAAEVKARACALPAETGVPLARWSSSELATEAVSRGVVPAVSTSTVRRWLNGDAIKPWQCRSWIFPRDPAFPIKAARVLDLDRPSR
jgi:Homeodomain-like domain